MNRLDLNAFVRAYVDCLLWCSLLDTGDPDASDNPSPYDAGFSADDLAPDDFATMRERAVSFAWTNRRLLRDAIGASGYSMEQAGHDLALTEQRHGAGFWDRGLGPVGDALTAATDSVDSLFWDDDGTLRLM